MIEHPILFSAPMVRAILDGRKTQTRRVMKPAPELSNGQWVMRGFERGHEVYCGPFNPIEYAAANPGAWFAHSGCPYGQPGDRLWVRETFYSDAEDGIMLYRADGDFDADMHHSGCKWQPSIFMPRLLSRITLEVTGVRVERLQDASESDCVSEGVTVYDQDNYPAATEEGRYWTAAEAYKALWDKINSKRAPWASNPWVWVIEFKRVPQ